MFCRTKPRTQRHGVQVVKVSTILLVTLLSYTTLKHKWAIWTISNIKKVKENAVYFNGNTGCKRKMTLEEVILPVIVLFVCFSYASLGETFSICLSLPVPRVQRQNNSLSNNKYSHAGRNLLWNVLTMKVALAIHFLCQTALWEEFFRGKKQLRDLIPELI